MIKKTQNLSNNNGFGLLGIVLIILVLSVASLVGWHVFNNSNESTTEDTSEKDSIAYLDGQYIIVQSWGVKIGISNIGDKISISGPTSYEPQSVKISVKPEYDAFKDCTSFITISKYKKWSEEIPAGASGFEINGYDYTNSAVSECGGATVSLNSDALSATNLLEIFNGYGVSAL
jgi:hypothetical protein